MRTKTTQKALAMLLALTMLFSLIPSAAFADDGIELAEEELPIVEITEDEEPAADLTPEPEEIPDAPAADNIPDEPVGDDALGVPSEEEEEELLELFADLTLSDEERFERGGTTYLDANGDSQDLTENYTVVESGSGAIWGSENTTTWYVVNGADVQITGYVNALGDVHLILTDGAKLTVNGLIFAQKNFTVYGQSEGTGSLIVNNENDGIVAAENVTINGGTVTANTTGTNSRGISAETLTVNGGTVTASGGDHAIHSGPALTITIADGMTVTAGENETGAVPVEVGTFKANLESYKYARIAPAVPAAPEPVPYMAWENGELVEKTGDEACTNYTVVESSTPTPWGSENTTTWYVVNGAGVQITGDVSLKGDVRLILTDGAELTVNGSIKDADTEHPGSLTVYGQSGGTGTLTVNSGGGDVPVTPIFTYGSVTINGGTVTAIGGGISTGNITINGGTVTANGSISTGNITINGGTVKAQGSGVGINATTVTIKGGTVTAQGNAVGIQGSERGSDSVTIEGGTVTAQGNYYGIYAGGITITGGDVTAQGGQKAIAYNGTLDLTGMKVKAGDSAALAQSVTAYGGQPYVRIKPVPAPVPYRVATVDDTTHAVSFSTADCTDYTVVDSTTTWGEGWYVVPAGELTIYGTVTLTGDVHLILTDNAKLTATDGIFCGGQSLTVYAQSEGESMGALEATIGTSGDVTINGGRVTATGADYDYSRGISASGTVTINGGTVTASATGYGSYGIGGDATTSTVIINGGTVTASATGNDSYGIDVDGNVAINGGTVTASGGSYAISGALTIGDGVYLLGGESGPSYLIEMENGVYTRYPYMKTTTTEPHTHKVTENGVTKTLVFQPWTDTLAQAQNGATAANSLPDTAGSYYLTGDVTLSSTWEVPAGTKLCLNGHGIKRSGSGSVINIGANVTFDLYDSGSTTHSYTINNNGLATVGDGDKTFTGGYITGGKAIHGEPGGVLVNGTFNMHGGTIIGNTSEYDGGGVYLDGGTFTMTGGSITGNTATGNGGGVYLDGGTFTMTGGSITGNTATNGGGGGVYLGSGGTFTMSGGSITDNSTRNGGGVQIMSDGSFTMEGGSITGNKATGFSGGGVFLLNGTFNMTGGRITDNTAPEDGGGVFVLDGTFNLSGNPTISGNKAGTGNSAKDNNVLLDNGKTINVTGALQDGASVGVTMANPGVFTASSQGVTARTYRDRFTSDSSTLSVRGSDGELMLDEPLDGVAYRVATVDDTTHAVSFSTETCTDYTQVTSSEDVTWGSENTPTWYVVATDTDITGTVALKGDVHLILTDGATLTVTNGISCGSHSLTIYAQREGEGMGALEARISSSGNVTINGGTVTANATGNGSRGIYTSGTVTINGGTVNASATDRGILALTLTVNGGTVTANATGNGSRGIYSGNTLTINGGTVTASATDRGIAAGTLTITGGTVNASATGTNSYGIYGAMNVTITGGTVNANATGNGIYGAMNVTITGGSLTASGGKKAINGRLDLGDGMYLLGGESGPTYLIKEGDDYTSYHYLKTIAATENLHTHEVTEGNVTRTLIFEPWSGTNSLPTTSGSYYLTGDVELNSMWNVPENSTVKLCLNGHTISNGSDDLYTINVGGANLSVFDEGSGKITKADECAVNLNESGTFKLYGGTVSGVYSTDTGTFALYGGTVSGEYGVQTNGTFTMSGGTITGGVVEIKNQGKFTMSDGTITGNALYSVQVLGTFTMEGGTITGNTKGGGVRILSAGTLTMRDGSITGNKGGVSTSGTFTMEGGSITGNNATVRGGGVYVGGGTFTMEGGSITDNTAAVYGGGVYVQGGTFKLSDNPTISGNKTGTGENAKDNNVYLLDGKTINVTGALQNGASVGVTMQTPGVFTTTSGDNIKASDYAEKFTSDNAEYGVYASGDELKLAIPVEYRAAAVDGTTHEVTFTTDTCTDYTVVKDSSSAVTWGAGWYVVKGNVALNGVTLNGDVHLILTDGAKLTVTGSIFSSSACSLTVYAQSEGESMGALDARISCTSGDVTVNGGRVTAKDTSVDGISGNSITINGGIVQATGGTTDGSSGISTTTLTINGGTVNASGTGEGNYGIYSPDTLTINGGTVNASATGNGIYANTPTVNGGTVNATGSTGFSGNGVTINGGTVNASGDQYGIYPGSGHIEIKGGTVTASGGNKAIDGTLIATGMFIKAGADETSAKPVSAYTSEKYARIEAPIDSGNCGLSGSDNVKWILSKDGTLYIYGTGNNPMGDFDPGEAPWSAHLNRIKSVVIESGVTSIGHAAFEGCEYLESVTIPGTVTTIGTTAFRDCEKLESVTIQNGVTDIGGDAFKGCTSLTSVTIPNTVTRIGANAFSNCEKLATVTFELPAAAPQPLEIRDEAFHGTPAQLVYGTGFMRLFESGTQVEPDKNLADYVTMSGRNLIWTEIDHEHDGITFIKWTDALAKEQNGDGKTAANSLPATPGNYFLAQDVTLSDRWEVPAGETKLCLNGHGIKRSGSGSVINIGANVTFDLYDCGSTTHSYTINGKTFTGGYITGGNNNYGGGVYVDTGTFNMHGGTIIGNTTNYGGGVYLNSGSFTMSGGSITGNTANGYGGGVFLNGGTFTMSGGEISGNSATNGGVFVGKGTFTMSDGSITGNTATENGGGVYINGGMFTMSDGSITGNTANLDGGGVMVSNRGTFTMEGGSITGNTATFGGGGVYVYGGTFKPSGDVNISGNTMNNAPSNVYLRNKNTNDTITVEKPLTNATPIGVTMANGTGVFTTSGANITASTYAAKFTSDSADYIVDTDTSGELRLRGTPHTITVSDAIENGAVTSDVPEAGVGETVTLTATPTDTYVLTAISAASGTAATPVTLIPDSTDANKFTFTMPAAAVTVTATFAPVHTHDDLTFQPWTDMAARKQNGDGKTAANSLPKDAGSYYLIKDVTLSDTWNVPKGETNFCLNGKTVTQSGTGNAIYIQQDGTLNLYDEENDSGAITFAYTDSKAIVRVEEGAVFTMHGGQIKGNPKNYGVFVRGSFTMHGGSISDNKNNGVNVSGGTFTMLGGTITGNTANSSGAGVYVSNGGTFDMRGGSITGNQANNAGNSKYFMGGGVYVYNGTVKLSGDVNISGNTANGKPSNIFLDNVDNNNMITVTGALTNDTPIGVLIGKIESTDLTLTPGVFTDSTASGTPKASTYAEKFTSDYPTWKIVADGDELRLAKHSHTVGEDTIEFDAWTEADSLPTTAGNYVLAQDVTLSDTWEVPEGTTMLCLGGKKITGNASGLNGLIFIPAGADLTLYDDEGNSGAITNKNTENTVGGVCVKGSFTMYGGSITGNKGNSVGGVLLNDNSAKFTMFGGKITDNEGASGNAVGGVAVYQGSFDMRGGEITGNRGGGGNETPAGGVHAQPGTTVTLSGSANITGNKTGPDENAADSNLCLMPDTTLQITGALDKASIGIKIKNGSGAGIFTAGSSDALKASTYAENFTSDDDKLRVETAGNELKLAKKPIPYLSYAWDETNSTIVRSENTLTYDESKYEYVTGNTTWLGGPDMDTWYVVKGAQTIGTNARIEVKGRVNLILMDGATLTVPKGLNVIESNTLTIYAQSEGDNMGKLVIDGAVDPYSGIGSGQTETVGSVTIHGGDLEVTGGTRGAGIGGGNGVPGGTVTIYGGTVKATGGAQGAGIGGGSFDVGGTVTIYGGTVTATGGKYGAGIGGGLSGAGGTVMIYGGTVTATGAGSGGEYGAGIGGGSEAVKHGDLYVATTHVAYASDTAINVDTRKQLEDKEQGTGTENVSSVARKQYMLVRPDSLHEHNFEYNVRGGNAIDAVCLNETNCPLPKMGSMPTITLTIAAPLHTAYADGKDPAAILDNLDAFNEETGSGLTLASVRYYAATKSGESYTKTGEPLTATPTDAGNYVAEITVDDATASVGYSIARGTPAYATPSDLKGSFADKLSAVSLPAAADGAWTWQDTDRTVGLGGEFAAVFTPNDLENYAPVPVMVPVALADPTTSVTVTLSWIPAAPSDVTQVSAQLMANGKQAVDALNNQIVLTLTPGSDWSTTVENLPKYDVNGRISYTLETSSVTSAASGEFRPTATVTVGKDDTAIAVSYSNGYTVKFDANGGNSTSVPQDMRKLHDTALTLPAQKPTHASDGKTITVRFNPNGGSVDVDKLTANRSYTYQFTGWNTAADGKGTSYAPGGSYTENAETTLYAQWRSTSNTESITFPTPVREGYTFKGWSTNKTAAFGLTGTYVPSFDQIRYAIWQVNKYTVTFDTDGGTEIEPITQDYGTAITAPADPTREGYTFTGWDPALPETMPARDLTLKATWKRNAPSCAFALNLTDGFGIYFYVSAAANCDGLNITWTKKDGTVETHAVTDGDTAGGYYVFLLDTVTAREMTDTIPVTITDTDSGETLLTTNCSVKAYCDAVFGLEGYENLRPLCQAVMDYGTYAQRYFNYRTDDLPNPDADGANLPAVPETYKPRLTGACTGIVNGSIALNLQFRTELLFYFFLESGDYTAANYEVTVRSAAGAETHPAITQLSANTLYVAITGIPATKLGDTWTVTMRNKADGTETVFTGSALSYSYLQQNDAGIGNTAKGLYDYYLKAISFF